jgi:hypothetical protein
MVPESPCSEQTDCFFSLPSIGKSAETSNEWDGIKTKLSYEEYFVNRTSSTQGSSLNKTLLHQDIKEVPKEMVSKQCDKGSKHRTFELQHKLVLNESSSLTSISETPDGNIPGRFPLKDCSNKPGDLACLSRNSEFPAQTPLKCPNDLECTPSMSLSSFNPSSLDNSLIKVTLKKHSSSKHFQPSLDKKRRTLSSQFQPYVPKKQRLELQSAQKPVLLEYDHQSDSGYSSPSSVSSCGSTSSGGNAETEQKIPITDDMEKMETEDENHGSIAAELEKLLPDCLLNSHNKRLLSDDHQSNHKKAVELNSISQDQDKFIRNLLFNE